MPLFLLILISKNRVRCTKFRFESKEIVNIKNKMFIKYQIGLNFAFKHLFSFMHLLKCARPHPVGHPVDDVSLVRRYRVL